MNEFNFFTPVELFEHIKAHLEDLHTLKYKLFEHKKTEIDETLKFSTSNHPENLHNAVNAMEPYCNEFTVDIGGFSSQVYLQTPLESKPSLSLTFYIGDKTNFKFPSDDGEKDIKAWFSNIREYTFIFFDDGGIFSKNHNKLKTKTKKMFPSNLKSFKYMPYKMREVIFEFFAKKNPIWKDILKYDISLPISLDLIKKSRTIKNLFENKFNVNLPKSTNKKHPQNIYAMCCALKYVFPEQVKYIMEENIDSIIFIYSGEHQKTTAKNYLTEVIIKRIINSNNRSEHARLTINLILGYVDMAFQLGEKINALAGMKTIKRFHDEYAIKLRVKLYKQKMIIPKNELSKIKLPSNFIRITTTKKLAEESVKNNNCVMSYLPSINKGLCLIYALDYEEKHYTIDIRYTKRNGYWCREISSYRNQAATESARQYVDDALKQINAIRDK